MIEYLEELDRSIVLAINGWHTPFFDQLMWWISAKITWLPLYLLLLYLGFKNLDRKQFIFFVASVLVAVAAADLISVHLFKNVFLRYRPSHHALLTEKLHFYEIHPGEFYKGGQYGFVSSHASNFFALAVTVGLILKKYYTKLLWILIAIGILVCFSRIYLGVHYLSDVLVGAMIGSVMAFVSYTFIFKRFQRNS